jgi:conjugal transfer pilus assembly protein TraK
MARFAKIFTAVALALAIAPAAHALQVITPVEGESTFVNISQKELNMITFPFDGLRAFTSSQGIDIKVQSRQVLITMSDQSTQKPQEVFFSTPYGTYLLMLVPKAIPAETVVVQIDKARIEEAEDWESEHDYIKRLKELVKSLYMGIPPSGYAMSTDKVDVSQWEGIEQTIVSRMTGAGLIGEVHQVTNHSTQAARIIESEFYREGVLAVSLTGHELRPGKSEQAFIVRKNRGSVGNLHRFVGHPLAVETGGEK